MFIIFMWFFNKIQVINMRLKDLKNKSKKLKIVKFC